MQVVVVVGASAFEKALAAAGRLGADELFAAGKLNAPLGALAKGRASAVWDLIEEALRSAYGNGVQAARPFINEAASALDQLIKEAGNLAREVKEFIAEKLQQFVDSFVDAALARVKPAIVVGKIELGIAKVTISQKLVLNGDLNASLEKICSMSANGEIGVNVEYGGK